MQWWSTTKSRNAQQQRFSPVRKPCVYNVTITGQRIGAVQKPCDGYVATISQRNCMNQIHSETNCCPGRTETMSRCCMTTTRLSCRHAVITWCHDGRQQNHVTRNSDVVVPYVNHVMTVWQFQGNELVLYKNYVMAMKQQYHSEIARTKYIVKRIDAPYKNHVMWLEKQCGAKLEQYRIHGLPL